MNVTSGVSSFPSPYLSPRGGTDETSPSSSAQTESSQEKTETSATSRPSDASASQDPAVQAHVAKLQATDAQVRAHEAAHLAAGGGVVGGGASFSYTKGPDGKMYATGGEVPIDTSGGKTPEETILKARQIVAAAMAPADPSPQDYRVAATAAMMEMRARAEMAKELQDKVTGREAYASNALSPSDTQSSAA